MAGGSRMDGGAGSGTRAGGFVEVKVKRTRGGVELEGSLPAGIAGTEALEVFPLRDGIYLVAAKGALERARLGEGGEMRTARGRQPFSGDEAANGALALSGEERALLKKLLAIRFEKRTPAAVDGALSARERETLASLAAKKAVSVFTSRKYPKGVYNISDTVYGQAREEGGAHRQESGLPGRLAGGQAHEAHAASDPLARSAQWRGAVAQQHDLLAKGWLVLESEAEARALSGALEARVKAGEVSGLRAFDRRCYFITRRFADEWKPALFAALGRGSMTAEELARECGLEADGCRALLLHLCEGGELLEKSRGRFALA